MLVLLLILPLAGIIFLNILPKSVARHLAFIVNCIFLIGEIILTLWISNQTYHHQSVDIGFVDSINHKLVLDFFSTVLLITISLIALMSAIINRYSKEGKEFYFTNLVLLITIGMNGIVLVRDIFSLYVFLEITAAATLILISLYQSGDSLEGAFKYFFMSAVATIFMLSGIAMIFNTVGNLEYPEIYSYITGLHHQYPITIVIALILFLTGLSIKAGLVPFHGWLPDTYTAAPNSVSILIAGIVTKITGVYTLMRLTKDVFGNIPTIQNILLGLGIISILIGAIAAIGQSDFKRLLAYSSISQVGYIIIGAALGTPLGFIGAIAHFFNHAVFKSLLFVNSNAVELQIGHRDINKMGGIASKMPITGGTSIIGFLSTAGIPPLSGFWSKLIIIIALWQTGNYAIAVIALLASLLTMGYFLIVQRKVFFGKLADGLENITETKFSLALPALLLSFITIIVGLFFPLILRLLEQTKII